METSIQTVLKSILGDTFEQILIDLYIAYKDTRPKDQEYRDHIIAAMKECISIAPNTPALEAAKAFIQKTVDGNPEKVLPESFVTRISEAGRNPQLY